MIGSFQAQQQQKQLQLHRRAAAACPAPRSVRRRRAGVVRASLLDQVRSALDFGRASRLQAINQLYARPADAAALDAALAADFTMGERGFERKFDRKAYLDMLARTTRAIPNFTWGHATTGEADDRGFCVVTVAASGSHTGAPLELPGLPPLPPSGRHFCLAEEAQLVKVLGGKVAAIEVLPAKGAGPRALYAALGGTLPAAATAGAAAAAEPTAPVP